MKKNPHCDIIPKVVICFNLSQTWFCDLFEDSYGFTSATWIWKFHKWGGGGSLISITFFEMYFMCYWNGYVYIGLLSCQVHCVLKWSRVCLWTMLPATKTLFQVTWAKQYHYHYMQLQLGHPNITFLNHAIRTPYWWTYSLNTNVRYQHAVKVYNS